MKFLRFLLTIVFEVIALPIRLLAFFGILIYSCILSVYYKENMSRYFLIGCKDGLIVSIKCAKEFIHTGRIDTNPIDKMMDLAIKEVEL